MTGVTHESDAAHGQETMSEVEILQKCEECWL